MKKILLPVVMALCVTVASVVPSYAAQAMITKSHSVTLSTSKPSSCTFKKAWERTRLIYVYDKNTYVGDLCYGYNTTWINEDYVWSRSGFYKHKSVVTNDKGTFNSATKVASTGAKWAKIEVTHKGTSPKYKVTYTNVADSEVSSDFIKGTATVTNNK